MISSLKCLWKKNLEKSHELLGGLIGGLFVGLVIGALNGFFKGMMWGETLFGGTTVSTFNAVLGSVIGMCSGAILGAIVGMIAGLFLGAIIGIFASPLNGVLWGGIHGLLVGISLGVIQELFERNFVWLLFNYQDIQGSSYLTEAYGYREIILLLAGIFIRAWYGLYTLTGAFIGIIIGVFVAAIYSSLANRLAGIIPNTRLARILRQSAVKPKSGQSVIQH